MPSTTNFGWTTPADTDLVKDGASAIRTLGNGIDASLVDLKGGTTGQVLTKNSNTDLDFVWSSETGDISAVVAGTGISGGGTSGSVTITNSMATEIAASGDIIVGTGSGTFDNLPIGTTGQVLTADTSVSPYKVKWATAGGGQLNQQIFTSSTSWTVPAGVTRVWALVVGGGGAGGYVPGSLGSFAGAGGGGGGGGIIETTLATTPGASITVTVGAGGSATPYPTATDGSSSVFGTLTAGGGRSGGLVGGAPAGPLNGGGGAGGGSINNGNPTICSSGGGGSTLGDGGFGVVGGGSNGSWRAGAYNAGDRSAGWGGSAESASTISGNGDVFGGTGAKGIPFFDGTRFGLGGGGGGAIANRAGSGNNRPGRATHGGGDGASVTSSASAANGSDGTANTGGGGGGGASGGASGTNANGGAGGSGIVIVRWIA